jgi:peptide chain release factor 2
MRERTQLETQIEGITKLERDVEDALTLIELGEMEEDEATIAEAEAAIKAVEAEAGRLQVESLLSGEADGNRHLSRDPSGRRRHREPGLGRDAAAHVHALGERRKFKVETLEIQDGEEGWDQVGDDQVSRATTPMAG